MSTKKTHNRFDSAAESVLRFDLGASPISGVKVTGQGFLKIPGNLTRVGVLKYTQADGSTVRELRPAEEVFKQDSLDTLDGATVTEGHHGMITPKNVKEHSVGIMAGRATYDSQFVKGTVTVQDESSIAKVTAKELIEISPGYTCEVDPTPGTFNGERYDQIQRNIKYNHIALLKSGAGRSGPEVSLRVDSKDAFSVTTTQEKTSDQNRTKEIRQMKKIRITLDGVDYEIEVAEGVAVTVESAFAKQAKERADSKAQVAKLEGEATVHAKELADTKERLDSATSPATLEKMVAERANVIKKATAMAPEEKFDGLSLDEIKKAALVAGKFVERETLDSKDSGFVDGAFTAVTIEDREDGEAKPAQVPGVSFKRQDGADEGAGKELEMTPNAAHARMCERNRNMYEAK